MEQFYLAVRILVLIYVLHEVFRLLFGKQAESFWRFLTPKPQEEPEKVVSQPNPIPYSVVGKSQTTYLEAPPEEKPIEPVFSEDLERIPAYEEEPDISSDDVDDNLNEEMLAEEDYFTPFDIEPDSEFTSSGLTYDQIVQALEVVQGKATSDSSKTAAARILYEINGSDLFDFLTTQAENEAMIERLLKENLDDTGEILPESEKKKRKEMTDFDIEKYV